MENPVDVFLGFFPSPPKYMLLILFVDLYVLKMRVIP